MSLVSVIIPTIRRPLLVRRAIASVQAQTHCDIEIIVVIDGPDQATVESLAGIAEPRLRVIQNPVSLCAGGARNVGAREAKGEWLAFLDDDDEWLPEKLERQLAGRVSADPVIVTCRCTVENATGRHVWPHRLYDSMQPVDEYLYVPHKPGRGQTYLATPTFLLPAWLFAKSGFGDTRQDEDTTLLLRLTKRFDAKIVMLAEALVVVHESPAESLGFNFRWRDSLAWADSMDDLITPKAYAGYCLIMLGSQAAKNGDLGAIPILLGRAMRRGAPTLMQLTVFASFWVLPAPLRRNLRQVLQRFRPLRPVAPAARGSDPEC